MDVSKFSLEGKVALVTGGSRGIGRAIALTFADAGADVVITSRKLPALEEVAEEIRGKDKKCTAIACHVAHTEESIELIDRIKSDFGRLDILVNNAGTNPYYGPLIDAEEWAWDATMNVNLKGPFILSQLAAKVMREKDGGSIINMSSVGGLKVSELYIYNVTKAALIMLTKAMAKEWGQYNIRVNAIAPGIIQTRLSEVLWKDPTTGEAARKSMALLRLGVPQDVADVAHYLASDASSYVTGETIVVDGGQLVGGPPAF